MSIRNLLVLVGLGFMLLAGKANAQAVRSSLRHNELTLEVGTTVRRISVKNLDINVWASSGMKFENNILTGSVAALIEPIPTKGFKMEVGPSYTMKVGGRPVIDFVVQFSLRENQSLAVSYNRIHYQIRF